MKLQLKQPFKDIDGAPIINTSKLTGKAAVPEIENNKFQEIVNKTKEVCPLSRALNAFSIEADVKLVPENYIVS
ncbi:MAG: hypothetical protein R6W84_13865 [Promethearchaeia archaeon]